MPPVDRVQQREDDRARCYAVHRHKEARARRVDDWALWVLERAKVGLLRFRVEGTVLRRPGGEVEVDLEQPLAQTEEVDRDRQLHHRHGELSAGLSQRRALGRSRFRQPKLLSGSSLRPKPRSS